MGGVLMHLTVQNASKGDITLSKPRNVECFFNGEQGLDSLDNWSGPYALNASRSGVIQRQVEGECADCPAVLTYEVNDTGTQEPMGTIVFTVKQNGENGYDWQIDVPERGRTIPDGESVHIYIID